MIHSSIIFYLLVHFHVVRVADVSSHNARGGVHLGLVTSPLQGHRETNKINNYAHSHLGQFSY